MPYVVAYLASALIFLAIDAVWLGLVIGPLFAEALGDRMRDEVLLPAAVGFYLVYLVGVIGLAVRPALAIGNWRAAAWRGALLGLCAYGTYDFTNLAVMRDWPVVLSLADTAWGTLLTAVTALAGYAAGRRVGGSQA